MKKVYVLNGAGDKLFEGTRTQCKQFIRKNRLSKAAISEKFVEKKTAFPATEEVVEDNVAPAPAEEIKSSSDDEETKLSLFNRLFK